MGNQRIDCLGCRLANSQEKSHIIFEDSLVTCLLDHEPFNEGHLLILPKKHIVEKEEGMNHLCITFERSQVKVTNITIDIQLPEGLFKTTNLNGYRENRQGQIEVKHIDDEPLLIELYTEETVLYPQAEIAVACDLPR